MANQPRAWTVVVFMAPETDLELYADLDLQEMQAVGSNRNVNVVVQLKRRRFANPARFLMQAGGRKLLSEPRSNAARNALESLLDWATKRFPARRYLLVLWGHAFGLQFSNGHETALTINQLASVFAHFRRVTGRKLDLLGFDSCSMSTVEAAYQLRDGVDYLVASPIGTPFAGWPYREILQAIQDRPAITSRLLGRRIVTMFAASYRPPDVSLALVELDRTTALERAIDDLAIVLTRVAGTTAGRRRIEKAFRAVADTGPSSRPERALVDLGELCRLLCKRHHDEQTRAAASKLRAATTGAVVHYRVGPHNHAGASEGLGIYVPNVAARADWQASPQFKRQYERLDLMRRTHWDELVYSLRR